MTTNVNSGIDSSATTNDVLASKMTSSSIGTTTTVTPLSDGHTAILIGGVVGGFCLFIIAAVILLVCLYICRSRKRKRVWRYRPYLLPNQIRKIPDPRASIDKGMPVQELPYWVSKVDELFLKTYNPYYHNYTYFGQGVRSNRIDKNVTNEP